MRRNWKRGAAALLTASMLFSNISMTGLAEEEVSTQADEVAVQAEEAPETAAQTEAPAPATEAPTEAPAPVTEAPTEAPAPETATPTEAPTPETAAQTEAPAPATEAQTEAKTEKQTQASETQSESEKKTEKESEEGIYTIEEKNYTVTIEMPDDCKIPEGAELVTDIVKKDTKEAKEDLKLAKETAGKDTEITGYQIYDLHFEKDNKEVELTPREKADIKVTLTIDKKEFRKDLDEKDLEVFHIRDLTEEELKKKEESEAASQEQSEKETESEKKSDEPMQTAEKLKIKKAEEKDGKEIITFSTDGFSDYLFAVTKEKETEKQTEKQTESETKKAIKTEPQTNAPIATHDGETQTKQQADLTLTVQSVGTKTEAKDLVIMANNITKLKTAVDALGTSAHSIKVTQGTADITADIKINEDKITIPAKYVEDGKSLKIAGLPVKGDDATAEAEYSINMSGNYINAGKLTVSSDYYTVYKDTINNELASTNGSYTFKLTGDLGLSIENVYSAVTFTASGTDKPDNKFAGMKYDIIPEGATTPAYTITSDNNGEAVLKGLPGGKYTVTGDTSTIPLTYWSESKSQNITISDSRATAVELKTYKPITMTLKSTDSRTGKGIAKAKFTVKKTDGTGKSTTVTADSNGQATLVGVLERGAKYTITQSRVSGHYSATSKNLSSSTYTVNKDGEDPVIAFSNQPTVLKVGVIDNVSKTSPYSGSYIKGATVEILKVNKDKTTTLVKTITTEGQLTEIIGALDPGTYQVKQTAAPAGYIVGARTEKGTQSVGKQISLSSKTKAEKTVAISADTVKVLVTRKGYDSRTQVTKNGKKAYEYTNLKVLSGAKMEIRDKDGNVVKDQNGNPVSWTSSSQGGHLVEGVLAANTEYTLVETGAPSGYDQAGSGKFHTYKSGNQAAVTMQTRRASGSIRVVMRAAYKGDAIKVNGTYYCALFTDKNLTKRYVAAGVRRLTMTTSQVYAEATFENIPAGVYYVAETDKNGNPLKDNATFKVNNPEEGLHMDTSKDLIAEITNDFVTEPAGAQKVSSSELKRSYNSEYAGYGGSASAAAQLAAGGNAVQTGDTTNFMLYVSMLAAACALFAAVIIMRKRREK